MDIDSLSQPFEMPTSLGPHGSHMSISTGSAEQQGGSDQPPNMRGAFSYLQWVKLELAEEPDMYEKFLNIMVDFQSRIIDIPGVVERVSNLFRMHPALIQGFNVFLPAGYHIETGDDVDPNTITLVAPARTTTYDLNAAFRQLAVTETTTEIASRK